MSENSLAVMQNTMLIVRFTQGESLVISCHIEGALVAVNDHAGFCASWFAHVFNMCIIYRDI